ncbi:hypothetical protein [Pseudomonas pseudonitroreducens]|uniref:hypothetical protein n=1 Tax=Pseudomonas pseudonitroreducens TaxID=2892326 RepID=UPI001F1B0CDB|nr:hypothetical protein [Pseudomonas pseudonitroreducens]
MGCNEHRDLERSDGLNRLLDSGTLAAGSRQEILARYILNHGFAALSEAQQQEFHDDLLPLIERRDRSEGLMPQGNLDPALADPLINDPGNEDPGSLIEMEVAEGLRPARRGTPH